MRGKAVGRVPVEGRGRITPACAGKSKFRMQTSAEARDHPRVCGEKLSTTSTDIHPAESPLRMRGKDPFKGACCHLFRITPACAGKSCCALFKACSGWDHPRVCGEKQMEQGAGRLWVGSPPRVRGKVCSTYAETASRRITPACAGKSVQSSRFQSLRWDHPRVCGETKKSMSSSPPEEGLPPRMRGKDHGLQHIAPDAGITPACAGKRRRCCRYHRVAWDHPRVCGEKFHPASDRKLGRVQGTKRSSGPAPAAAPAGLAGSCPASPPWSYPPRITVSRPRP